MHFSTADSKSLDKSHRRFAEQTTVFLHCQTKNLDFEIKLVTPYHLDRSKNSMTYNLQRSDDTGLLRKR